MTGAAVTVTCFSGTHREKERSQPGLPLAITMVQEGIVDVFVYRAQKNRKKLDKHY